MYVIKNIDRRARIEKKKKRPVKNMTSMHVNT